MDCILNVVNNYEKLGQLEDEERQFSSFLKIFDNQQDNASSHNSGNSLDHKQTILERILSVLKLRQENQKAIDLLEKIIKIKTKLLDTIYHIDIATLYFDLATIYDEQELYEDATDNLNRAIEIYL